MALIDLCLPLRGPSLAQQSELKIDLSGTLISVKLPDSDDGVIRNGPKCQTDNLYDLPFGRWRNDDPYETEGFGLFNCEWQFHRLFLSDSTADVGFGLSVFHLPEFQSLFRPRRLECAIERLIYTTPFLSTQKSGESRLNWQVIDGPNQWIRYEYIGCRRRYEATEHVGVLWHLPLTDKHLLSVRFRFIYRSKNQLVRKKCAELMSMIMESFRVELSNDALQQKRVAQEAYPYEKISTSLPPYTFETPEILIRHDLIGKVSEQINHDSSYPDHLFEKLVEEADMKQRAYADEVRDRILKSHLRFGELEQQDYENHLANQRKSAEVG
jgi:hypothetical protein